MKSASCGEGFEEPGPIRPRTKWEYLWDEPRPASPHEIERLEREWGVRFPEQYKKLVAGYQGMGPEPSTFNIGRSENTFNVFLTLVVDEQWRTYSVMRAYEVVKPHVPSGIYPFANTPGGEYLCFDYRNSPDEPRIVLATVEMFLYPVADSFDAFLASLHDA